MRGALSREESLERLIDRRVQARLRTDSRYRYAESAEAAAEAEDVIELESEREVIAELLELAGTLEKYGEGTHAETVDRLRVRLGEIADELRPAGVPSRCAAHDRYHDCPELLDGVMPCGCCSGSCYCG